MDVVKQDEEDPDGDVITEWVKCLNDLTYCVYIRTYVYTYI